MSRLDLTAIGLRAYALVVVGLGIQKVQELFQGDYFRGFRLEAWYVYLTILIYLFIGHLLFWRGEFIARKLIPSDTSNESESKPRLMMACVFVIGVVFAAIALPLLMQAVAFTIQAYSSDVTVPIRGWTWEVYGPEWGKLIAYTALLVYGVALVYFRGKTTCAIYGSAGESTSQAS